MDQMVLKTQKWLNSTYSGVTGFTPFAEKELDGVTGSNTFKKLIQALQIELNTQYGSRIAIDGNFGDGTLKALPSQIRKSGSKNNITYIIQGALWCKGYSAGNLDGIYGNSVETAVKKFQSDAGIDNDGVIRPYILKGIMNTDSYSYHGSKGTEEYYKHLVQLGMNANYGAKIGLTAPNGLWERKSHKNLIKCCQTEWGISPIDGVWGNGTMNKVPILSKNKSGYIASKRLLQWGLTINGYYPGNLSGTFDNDTYNAIISFQDFLCLGADGIVGKNTWAALLSSKGNTSRSATTIDTCTRLTPTSAKALKDAGITTVGRYLTNAPSGKLDKKITVSELEVIKSAGLKIFPIFQTYGGNASYFTDAQGRKDSESAIKAAQSFGFPSKCTIFFAVDYDALMSDIDKNIIPYFQAINEVVDNSYKIGVYAPRAVCNRLYNNGLAEYSFVADMSNGFTGNIGQTMPKNWAYEQFFETTLGGIGVDKCVASSRETAVFVDEFITYDHWNDHWNDHSANVGSAVEANYKKRLSKSENIDVIINYIKGLETLYNQNFKEIENKSINCAIAILYYLWKDKYKYDFMFKLTLPDDEKFVNFMTSLNEKEEVRQLQQFIKPNSTRLVHDDSNRLLELSHLAVSTCGFLTWDGISLNLGLFYGFVGDMASAFKEIKVLKDNLGSKYEGSLKHARNRICRLEEVLSNGKIEDPVQFNYTDYFADTDACKISNLIQGLCDFGDEYPVSKALEMYYQSDMYKKRANYIAAKFEYTDNLKIDVLEKTLYDFFISHGDILRLKFNIDITDNEISEIINSVCIATAEFMIHDSNSY